jgi:hypothetical protein
MILSGYFLASLVPNIGQRIHYVIAAVIFLSFLPPVISALRARARAGTANSAASSSQRASSAD